MSATSAEVARHAGLSRSTVSQILNGRDGLFTDATIARVRAAAAELGYRPSVAGRTLARGTSDIVLTLIPDITFNSRLRELIDTVTAGLADAGLTNLLRFAGPESALDDLILGLKPFGVISFGPLHAEDRKLLSSRGVHVVEQSEEAQGTVDRSIGALQARHLAAAGYDSIVVAAPSSARELSYADAREAGTIDWASSNGLAVAPTVHVELDRGGALNAVTAIERQLTKSNRIGVAAYNDDVALAIVGAATRNGLDVPATVGVVGVDNSPLARFSTPSISTVDYSRAIDAQVIIDAVLRGRIEFVEEGLRTVTDLLAIVEGDSTLPTRD